MHSLKDAPLRLILPGLIAIYEPALITQPQCGSCLYSVHVALYSALSLAPAHQALLVLPTVMLALAH